MQVHENHYIKCEEWRGSESGQQFKYSLTTNFDSAVKKKVTEMSA